MSASLELFSVDDEFINCAQAATLLGVSKSTFNRICKTGAITPYRFHKAPKFKVEDIQAYIEQARVVSIINPSSIDSNTRIKLPRIK